MSFRCEKKKCKEKKNQCIDSHITAKTESLAVLIALLNQVNWKYIHQQTIYHFRAKRYTTLWCQLTDLEQEWNDRCIPFLQLSFHKNDRKNICHIQHLSIRDQFHIDLSLFFLVLLIIYQSFPHNYISWLWYLIYQCMH